MAQDVLFQRMLPGTTGVPLPRTRDCIKRMTTILEQGTPASKDRWPGHPSIPPRVFGHSQYLTKLLPFDKTEVNFEAEANIEAIAC